MAIDTIGSDGSDPPSGSGAMACGTAQGETLTNRALTAETMVRQLLVCDATPRARTGSSSTPR